VTPRKDTQGRCVIRGRRDVAERGTVQPVALFEQKGDMGNLSDQRTVREVIDVKLRSSKGDCCHNNHPIV